jgi:hypothetical protein
MPGTEEFTPEFFDECTRRWHDNKIRRGASYVYKCSYVLSSNRTCQNSEEPGKYFCATHLKYPKAKDYLRKFTCVPTK